MEFLVVSDDATITERLRVLLVGQCGAHVRFATTNEATQSSAFFQCDSVIMVLPADPSRASAAIRDLRELISARIVAVGPATDAKFILQLQREGVFHFVNQDDLKVELAAAVRRLRSEPRPLAQHGRVISVVSSGGGSGASTVSANIATALCYGTGQCGLLDFKLEAGDLASMLDLPAAHSLADFCRNIGRMDESMFETCFAKHSSGVRLLATPASISDIESITPQGARKAVAMSSKSFPYVVVDIGTPYRDEHVLALRHSDVVLLVMRLDIASLNQARRVLEHLLDLRVHKSKIQLVVNRFRRSRELRAADIEEALGLPVSRFVPDDPRNVVRAVNKGIPVVLEKPRARVSRELIRIARSVNGILSHKKDKT